MTTHAIRSRLAALLALTLLAISCGDDPLGPPAEEFADEPAPTPRPEVVAFVGVHVVPMVGDFAGFDQTVIVRGDRIETVGPHEFTEVPAGAFRIEGQGRYLVPGLADMHVHTPSQTFAYLRNDFVLWLANGVTTIRVMWGGSGILSERGRVESGETLGPTLLVASPGLDGPGGPWSPGTPAVHDAAEARARVAEHAMAGYDFIKVYNELSVASYEAIVEEAAARGLRLVGHVPRRVGIERVQDVGQLTLEHFIGIKLQASTPFTAGTLDLGRVRALAGRSAAAGVWHTPTITVDALSASRVAEIRAGAELRRVSPGMRSFFEGGFFHGLPDATAAREAENMRVMIKAVHDAGGGLLVGTDAGFGWVVPGYSIHDELRSFVQAGLSPYEAMRGATSGAADATGRAGSFGRIREGLRADLVLVTQNPLRNIEALEQISGVMVRGRWLSRGTLARMLDEIEAGYAGGAASVGPASQEIR